MSANVVSIFPAVARYGATPEDWAHFSSKLGLTEHLLPVVSNPAAAISPTSAMGALGKTPSRYNASRKVSGFAGWPKHVANLTEIAKWSLEPDYGICINTRLIRAIDIDIGDAKLSDAVQRFIDGETVMTTCDTLPVRSRANSGKRLMVFRLPGDMQKRTITTPNGIIEFLATGQQFIAAGCHPSGARYEWLGGLPEYIPDLDIDTFEAMWAGLEAEFGTGEASQARKSVAPTVPRTAPDKLDDVAQYLVDKSLAINIDKRTGRIDITCPFEDGHSTASSVSSTSYFPASVGGFDRGHFKCQHASCAHRLDNDFLNAIGYTASDFEVIEYSTAPRAKEPSTNVDKQAKHQASESEADWPAFQRDKNGFIDPILGNITAGLNSASFCKWDVAYDEFFDHISITPRGTKEWRPLRDVDLIMLRIDFEALGFKPIAKETMRDAVEYVALSKSFDSGKLWLSTLEWDGVPRVKTFFQKYFGVENQEYAEACSLYVWTAHAGRLLTPGIQADMSPLLIGAQGAGKSTAVKAIVPNIDFYADIDLTERDDNLSRRMRGKLVCEFGEMRGFNTRDLESLKAYVTRTHDEWVPKYKEFSTSHPRRCIMWGTCNEQELFTDATGNRRWLPMFVPGEVDVEGIARDRDQLWAEAALMYLLEGVIYAPAERLAKNEHSAFKVESSWKDAVIIWLNTVPFGGTKTPAQLDEIPAKDILVEALGKRVGDIKRSDEMKAAGIMKDLGYVQKRCVLRGVRSRVWVKEAPPF